MRVTVATLRVKPEKTKLYEDTFRELQEKVHAHEPGATFFELCRDPEDSCLYRVFEAYRDAEAIQEHVATPWYDATARIFLECLDGDHMEEIRRRGITDPREGYKLTNSLRLDRYETI